MDPIVFDNTVVQKHTLYRSCAKLLQQICDRDYLAGKYLFDSRIECLDMDSYERILCCDEPDKTVDAVIGISTCRNDKRKVNSRLMLIEFRMGYKSVATLSAGDLVEKVQHSKDLLGQTVAIDKCCCFIFDEGICEQAKRWLSNKAIERTDVKGFVAWSVRDFWNNILSYDDLPYKPIHDLDAIRREAKTYMSNGDVTALFKLQTFWLGIAAKYKYSNIYEYESLKVVVNDVWCEFKQFQFALTDDEFLDMEILQEEINTIL